MRPSFLPLAVALLSGAGLLASCCANNACECKDELADAIELRFKTPVGPDSTGFSLEELDTIRVVRTRLRTAGDLANAKIGSDTILVIPQADRVGNSLYIANTIPFAISGGLRINSYKYSVFLPRNRRKKFMVYRRYDLRNIMIKGSFQADGCCTCYENTEKKATLVFKPKVTPKSDSTVTAYTLTNKNGILLTRK